MQICRGMKPSSNIFQNFQTDCAKGRHTKLPTPVWSGPTSLKSVAGNTKAGFLLGNTCIKSDKKCKTSLSIEFMTTWGHKLGAFSLKHQAPGFGHCHAVLAKTSYPVHFPKDPHAGHLFEQLSSQMWLLMLAEKHVMCRSAVGCESDVKHRETMQLQDWTNPNNMSTHLWNPNSKKNMCRWARKKFQPPG